MKTVEEIVAYLESELAEAYELHDQVTDKNARLFYLQKATFITHILEEIKEG